MDKKELDREKKLENQIMKAMKENRFGDVVALQSRLIIDKEVRHIKKKIEDLEE